MGGSWKWVVFVVSFSCGPQSTVPPATERPQPDAPAQPDPVDPYRYVAPPETQALFTPETWRRHLEDDLLPFWRMTQAHGTPAGNFPTFRDMNGEPSTSRTERRPRMLGRQIYLYSMAYLMTGDEQLLEWARQGHRWLLDRAKDATRGGWHARLDAAGMPLGNDDKLAQDMSYVAMGPAAFFFVTRDPEAEAIVLGMRDLLFDPSTFWDERNRRIRDGMNASLTTAAFVDGEASWELVAQLDPISAFLLLVQPTLREQSRRDQVLSDLRTLATTIQKEFFFDGFFWGSTGKRGSFGSRHSDFGHMLKTYWMLTQIDKRTSDRPFFDFLSTNAEKTLRLAYDVPYERWGKKPVGPTSMQYGSDWWSAAEADQLAATLALRDPSWFDTVSKTSSHFVADYVDTKRAARELVPSVSRSGSPVYNWPEADTAKCNEWKNGFHSVEHALVMYLLGHWATKTPVPLYFAFPAGEVETMAARSTPYTFLGTMTKVEDLGPLQTDPSRHKVRVTFDQLR